jgi:hypothetical protein
MSIARIRDFEFLPLDEATVGIDRFRFKWCKTGSLEWCRRCMEVKIQLRSAWTMMIFQTAMEAQCCDSCRFDRFFHNWLQTVDLNHLQMMNKAKDSTKNNGFLMNNCKKVWRKIEKIERIGEFWSLDLRIVIVIINFCYDYAFIPCINPSVNHN